MTHLFGQAHRQNSFAIQRRPILFCSRGRMAVNFNTANTSVSNDSYRLNVSAVDDVKLIDKIEFYIYAVVVPSIVIVGTFGNSLNIYVLWRSHRFRTVSYTYLRFLAISDFLMITFAFQRCVIYVDGYTWTVHLSRFFSHALYPLISTSKFSSNFFIMEMTIDRYVAVCHPFKMQSLKNFKLTTMAPVISYGLAFLIEFPDFFVRRVISEIIANRTTWYWQWNTAVTHHQLYIYWVLIRTLLGKVMPLLTVLVLNPLILCHYKAMLRRRKRQKERPMPDQQSKANEDRHLVLLLTAASVVFVIGTVPEAVIGIVHRLTPPELIETFGYAVFRQIAITLDILNYSVNFFVYSLFSKDFRYALKEVFRRSNQVTSTAEPL